MSCDSNATITIFLYRNMLPALHLPRRDTYHVDIFPSDHCVDNYYNDHAPQCRFVHVC